MPTVIPNGGSDDITSAELGGYSTAADVSEAWRSADQTFVTLGSGSQTVQEAEIVSSVEEKLDAIVEGWIDSGGPGGYQRAVSREILRRAALLQGDLVSSVRQWAKPGRERAMLEMLGVLTKALVERDRLLLELRERLNNSPY
jgi:hypothetical protein